MEYLCSNNEQLKNKIIQLFTQLSGAKFIKFLDSDQGEPQNLLQSDIKEVTEEKSNTN